MSEIIFINYRRGEDQADAGRLYDQLEAAFDRDRIFIDVDGILPGKDFALEIAERVAASDIFLSVIGRNWVNTTDSDGNRRLMGSNDWVRVEIESALNQNKHIIPILVGGAEMPRAEQLPVSLEPFARKNAYRINHDKFRADVQGLIEAIKKIRGATTTKAETSFTETPSADRKPVVDQASSTSRSKWIIPGGVLGLALIAGAGSLMFKKEAAPLAKSSSPASVTANPATAPTAPKLETVVATTSPVKPDPAPVSAPGTELSAQAMRALGDQYANGVGVPLDYVKAREWYEKAANGGNSTAMNSLGFLYQNGQGVAQDYAKAKDWHEKAALAGNANSMNNLGLFYQGGRGVTQDNAKSREWYEKAANAGSYLAMNNLGVIYEGARGVPQDFAKAREWYERAANAGYSNAMNNIGGMYQNGRGGTPDYAKAREWYEKAANAGNTTAMRNIAVLYEKGLGVAQSDTEALKWRNNAISANPLLPILKSSESNPSR